MFKIALVGHDTRNPNLGVGALTLSNIEIIRDVAASLNIDVRFSILVGKSQAECYVLGGDIEECIVRPMRKPWSYFGIIRQHDLVIDIAGGDSFADIYGWRRIFQALLQQYLVHLARRPLIMAPQTIGPFNKGIWRRLAALSAKMSTVVCTRDRKSTDFLQSLGVRGSGVIEASDVAMRLPYDVSEQPRQQGPTKVGINVSGLLMSGGFKNKKTPLSLDYPKLIRTLITRFQSHPDKCELHLIGHVIPQNRGGVEDDYQACLDLSKEFPGLIVAPKFADPIEAKTYISQLDFFTGARMHACIAAFSSGVPVVPMAYSRKFEGLFGSVGYNLTADCTRADLNDVVNAVLKAYETRGTLASQLVESKTVAREKLKIYETALKQSIIRFAPTD